MSGQSNGGQNGHSQGGVMGKVVEGLEGLLKAAADRAMQALQERVGGLTDRLTEYASGGNTATQAALDKGMEATKGGGSPIGAAASAVGAGGKEQVKHAFGGGGGGGDDGGGDEGGDEETQRKTDLKVTNIIESIDVGVPVWLAYNQWTQFRDFPTYMKKVENVEQEEPQKLMWQAQVMWSHRKWESTIIEQVPDERIVWQSKADKGTVDGTVTFHELASDLTRILVVMQYHPKGFVEKTGNIWRAPGRRVRLELKHFVRQVMSQSILNPDDVKGWRGEIRDGEVISESDEDGESGESGEDGQGDQDQDQAKQRDQQAGDGRHPDAQDNEQPAQGQDKEQGKDKAREKERSGRRR